MAQENNNRSGRDTARPWSTANVQENTDALAEQARRGEASAPTHRRPREGMRVPGAGGEDTAWPPRTSRHVQGTRSPARPGAPLGPHHARRHQPHRPAERLSGGVRRRGGGAGPGPAPPRWRSLARAGRAPGRTVAAYRFGQQEGRDHAVEAEREAATSSTAAARGGVGLAPGAARAVVIGIYTSS